MQKRRGLLASELPSSNGRERCSGRVKMHRTHHNNRDFNIPNKSLTSFLYFQRKTLSLSLCVCFACVRASRGDESKRSVRQRRARSFFIFLGNERERIETLNIRACLIFFCRSHTRTIQKQPNHRAARFLLLLLLFPTFCVSILCSPRFSPKPFCPVRVGVYSLAERER